MVKRFNKCLITAMLLVIAGVSLADSKMPADQKSMESAKRWEKVMADFRNWDSENTFPENGILFVGSSSINLWKTRECFPDLPVINRGFGGSIYSDIIYWADTLIKPYNPKVIVLYSGDNDPYWGKSPERISSDFDALYSTIREIYPNVDVIVMATKMSQSRADRSGDFAEANQMLKQTAEKEDKLYYFDAASILFGKDGKPDPKLYREDKLHLNDAGYKIWTDNIRVLIGKLLSE